MDPSSASKMCNGQWASQYPDTTGLNLLPSLPTYYFLSTAVIPIWTLLKPMALPYKCFEESCELPWCRGPGHSVPPFKQQSLSVCADLRVDRGVQVTSLFYLTFWCSKYFNFSTLFTEIPMEKPRFQYSRYVATLAFHPLLGPGTHFHGAHHAVQLGTLPTLPSVWFPAWVTQEGCFLRCVYWPTPVHGHGSAAPDPQWGMYS